MWRTAGQVQGSAAGASMHAAVWYQLAVFQLARGACRPLRHRLGGGAAVVGGARLARKAGMKNCACSCVAVMLMQG